MQSTQDIQDIYRDLKEDTVDILKQYQEALIQKSLNWPTSAMNY